MDRGAWWASLWSRKELDMTEATSHMHTLPFGLEQFFFLSYQEQSSTASL